MPVDIGGNIISNATTREYEYSSISTRGLIFNLDASIFNTISGTSWFDFSGNGNHFTLNGPTFNSNNLGYFDFDGSNDITTTSNLDLRQTWSLEMWVNMDNTSTFYFFGQGVFSTNLGLHILQYNNTSLRFGMYANDTDLLNTSVATNTWYQYVFTYLHSSPFTKQIYRNGVLMSSTNVNTPTQYGGTGTVRIGSIYSSGNYFTDGKISICRLYNRILSSSEVLHNFNVNKHRYGL